MKASTGIFFSSASWRMRRKIRCDCAGEPPGELMISATARALRIEKARSSERAVEDSIRPGRSGVDTPMTPVKPHHRHDRDVGAEARRQQHAQEIEQAVEDIRHRSGRGSGHAGQLGSHWNPSQSRSAPFRRD